MVLQLDENFKLKHDKIDKTKCEDENVNSYWKQQSSYSTYVLPCCLKNLKGITDMERLKNMMKYLSSTIFGSNSYYPGGHIIYNFMKKLFKYHAESMSNIQCIDIEYDPRFTYSLYKEYKKQDLEFRKSVNTSEYIEYATLNSDGNIDKYYRISYNMVVVDANSSITYILYDTYLLTFKVDGNIRYAVLTFIKKEGSSYRFEPWMFSINKDTYDKIKSTSSKISNDIQMNMELHEYSESYL